MGVIRLEAIAYGLKYATVSNRETQQILALARLNSEES